MEHEEMKGKGKRRGDAWTGGPSLNGFPAGAQRGSQLVSRFWIVTLVLALLGGWWWGASWTQPAAERWPDRVAATATVVWQDRETGASGVRQTREDSTIAVGNLPRRSTDDLVPSVDQPLPPAGDPEGHSTPIGSFADRWQAGHTYSLCTLAVGVLIVVAGIIGLKMNAFLGLIVAALVVSLMSPGPWVEKISRVGLEFGASAGRLGLVIALAAVIGQSLMSSGAAERIVNFFIDCLGEKRTPVALCGSGYILSIPVFFDTVFYLLVPLARSAYLRTKKRYLACLLAIAAGGAITHTLVPPTPGPLLVASNLGVNLGTMMMVGSLIAIVAAMAGLSFAFLADRWIRVPFRWLDETEREAPQAALRTSLPPLGLALLPLLLPVLLIAGATVMGTWADQEQRAGFRSDQPETWSGLAQILSDPDRPLSAFRIPAEGTRDESSETAAVADPHRALAAQQVRQYLLDRLRPPAATRGPGTESTAEPASKGRERETLDPADGSDGVFVERLNGLLNQRDFYDEEVFFGVRFSDVTQDLLQDNRSKMPLAKIQQLNRLLLEDALAEWVPRHQWETPLRQAAQWAGMLGDPNLALLLAAMLALGLEKQQRRVSWRVLGGDVEKALASAGVIILITSAGGAFGAMLQVAEVGEAIRGLFSQYSQTGLGLLVLAFAITAVLKFAQGSSTVAMITASGMLASLATADILGCHPVYLATVIGAGSLFGSWMNDSGFWIFTKMGGLTTEEGLKTWTPCLMVLALSGGLSSLALAWLWPLT